MGAITGTIEWKVKGIFNADAELCYREISELGDEYTAEQVLEKARDASTELHKCFDWEDSVAAEKWRLNQARTVCRLITVKVVQDERPPVHFRIIQNTGRNQGYQPVTRVFQNPDKYAQLIGRMKRDAQNFINAYESLPEAEAACEALRELL